MFAQSESTEGSRGRRFPTVATVTFKARNVKRASALLCGIALALGAGNAAAAASDRTTQSAESKYAAEATAVGLSARQAAQLQDRMDAQLADIKVPAEQVKYNEIRTKDGTASITMSAPGVAADTGCSYEYLCLWDGANWTGSKLSFSACTFVDLSSYGFNDRLTSYKNNQTSGTVANFYNWEGAWKYKFGSRAYHTEDSLANTPWNNLIDGVQVC